MGKRVRGASSSNDALRIAGWTVLLGNDLVENGSLCETTVRTSGGNASFNLPWTHPVCLMAKIVKARPSERILLFVVATISTSTIAISDHIVAHVEDTGSVTCRASDLQRGT